MKEITPKSSRYFTPEERHKIIQEALTSGITKQAIWEKYVGEKAERGRILRWMRALGYETNTRMPNIVKNYSSMAKKHKTESNEENFENLQLKKRVAELEKQLKEAELKAIAFSTMVDIAEKEFKIPIRKKYNTKP